MIQMPESCLGADYAARIQSQTSGQISHIEAVAAQVTNWLDEIIQPRNNAISVMFYPKARPTP